MHGDTGVGREETEPRPRVLRNSASAPTASPILSGFHHFLVNTRRRFRTFLTETELQTELAVTHRK